MLQKFLIENLYVINGVIGILICVAIAQNVSGHGLHRQGNREFVRFINLCALTLGIHVVGQIQAEINSYKTILIYAAIPLMLLLPYHAIIFLARFTDCPKCENWKYRLILALPIPVIIIMNIAFVDNFWTSFGSNRWGYFVHPGIWSKVNVAYALLMALAGLTMLFRRRNTIRINKVGIALLTVGSVALFLFFLLFNSILPAYCDDYPFLGAVGLNIFVICVFVAIRLNQRFFDVEQALSDYERLKYFNLTSTAMGVHTPYNELLKIFTRNARIASDSNSLMLIEINDAEKFTISQFSTGSNDYHQHPKMTISQSLETAPDFLKALIKTGEPQTVSTLKELAGGAVPDEKAKRLQEASKSKRYVAMPVHVSGKLRGVLIFGVKRVEDDHTLYELFANQCAQIIRRSELLNSYKSARDEQSILLDNIDTLIWYFRDANSLGRVNRAFTDFFNLPASRVDGQPTESLGRYSQSLDSLIRKCSVLFTTGKPLTFEEVIENSSGEKRTLMITATPKINNSQIVEYAVCVGYDVTELRAIEMQLYHTQKMEAIGLLAGGIAHNFNNLLSSIVGYSDLISSESTEPIIKQYADRITIAGRHGSQLTQQLLAFARKGKYQNAPINLIQAVKDVVAIIENTFDRKIHISCKLAINEAVIEGDSSQIFQMLLNLAINSKDAMPNGGKLTFTVEEKSIDADFCAKNSWAREGTYYAISVIDTGTGIDDGVLPHIFEPFFTTKEVGKGVGLGLSSVYGCVKNHKGYITVNSSPGEGCIFTVYLPPLATENAIVNMKIQPTRPEIIVAPSESRHIMLIEDEEDVRTVTSISLSKAGYTVHGFDNGKSALEFYKDNWQTINAIILDITMPVMNGLECMKRLKWINPKAAVLIVSGHSLDNNARQLLDEGALKFIQKPWNRKEFINAVAEASHNTSLPDAKL